MQQPQAASAVYKPPKPNTLQDEPLTDHYENWGYSIGYEVDTEGQPVPEGGNTAVFRISPHGMTEPVYVSKPEENATFTVSVVSGKGEFIRATEDGKVENLFLSKGEEVVIRPGEAYFYRNTDQFDDLVLHDVALPAFQPGDDVELTSSYVPEYAPEPQEGRLSCLAKSPSGESVRVDLPEEFYEEVSRALFPQEEVTVEELTADIKFNLAFAAAGLALFGAGLYGNYSLIKGKHSGFEVLSWPTGATTLGGGVGFGGVKHAISLIRKRMALKRAQKAAESAD